MKLKTMSPFPLTAIYAPPTGGNGVKGHAMIPVLIMISIIDKKRRGELQ